MAKIDEIIADFDNWEVEYWSSPSEAKTKLCKKAKDKRYYQNHKEECNKRSARYASLNPDKMKDIKRRYYKNNTEKESLRIKKYISENVEKYKAHQAVRKAIVSGELIKKPCSICGSANAEAHHEDYSKQLDVLWLCHKCHMRHHAGVL